MGLLHWTIIFLIVAVVAAVLGFTRIASAAAGVARILFGIFLVLFLIALVFGLLHGYQPTPGRSGNSAAGQALIGDVWDIYPSRDTRNRKWRR